MKLSSGWIWKVLLNVAIRCNRSGLIRVKPRKRALRGECSRWSISEVVVFEVAWVLGAGLKNDFKVLRHKWDPDEAWRRRRISLASAHPTLRACDNNEGNTWPLACWECLEFSVSGILLAVSFCLGLQYIVDPALKSYTLGASFYS